MENYEYVKGNITNRKLMEDLIKIVDMYLDVEEKHYQEMIDNNETIHFHIFQSLLNVSLFIKDTHTMKENL